MLKFLIRSRPWGLRLDALWLIAVLSAAVFLTSLIPLPPNDFWWHLKIGEIIHESRSLPTANIFGWTIPSDRGFVYGAWLGEYVFYLAYLWGDLELVILTRTVLWAVTLGLIGVETHRRSGSWRLSAAAVLLVFLMSFNNLIVRPQNWSWVPFALFSVLLGAYADGRIDWKLLLLCPLMMVFWVNAHGAFVLGILLMGTYFVGETLDRLLKRQNTSSWRRILYLGAWMLLTVAATLVNPRGLGSLRYVLNLMTDVSSQDLVVEWQSPTPTGAANTAFYLCVLLLILVFWLSRRTPRATEVLLILGFLWMAWNGMRYVVWFAIIAMPILAQTIADLVPNKQWLVSPTRNYLNVVMAVVFCIPVILVQPWFVERWLPVFPEKYRELVLVDNEVGPLLGVETPLGAADYMVEHPREPIFNEMGYGSYFIWRLPDQRVFADPRVELYPEAVWEDYLRISHGIRYNALLESYGVERLVIDREMQEELVLSLEDDTRWQRVYEDTRAQIWDRVRP